MDKTAEPRRATSGRKTLSIDVTKKSINNMANPNALMQMLANPSQELTVEALVESWFHQELKVTITGFGKLSSHPLLLGALRRALGRQLMRSASENAIRREPCQWSPPCALDVFFREQLRFEGSGLPKPFVLSADRHRNDLILSIRVLGIATSWMPAVQEAFVAAIHHGGIWDEIKHGFFLPKLSICDVHLHSVEALDGFPLNAVDLQSVSVECLTISDVSGNNITEHPWSFVNRLCRRVEGLARWLDARLVADWSVLENGWRSLGYDLSESWQSHYSRWSGSADRLVVNIGVEGQIHIEGELSPFVPYFAVAQQFHVGRGAVDGYGRIALRSNAEEAGL